MNRSIKDLLQIRGLEEKEIRSLLEGERSWSGEFTKREAKVEKREKDTDDTHVDDREDTGELMLYGYSAVFDSDSEILYGFLRERIKRGAFKEVLRNNPDVRLLENHTGRPHARTTNNTLVLTEQPRGLFREAKLNPERSDSRDLYEAVKRGDYTQSSFAFMVGDDEWRTCDCAEADDYAGCDCVWDRTILRVSELLDDSIVTYPAYPESTATTERQVVTPSESAGDSVTNEGDTISERSVAAVGEERNEPAEISSPSTPESDIAEAIRIWLEVN